MLIDHTDPAERAASAARTRVAAAVVGAAALLTALQIGAVRAGFQGPLHSLVSDYVATPTASTVMWAGLGLALVGLANRCRVTVLLLAVAIDLPFAAARVARGGGLAFGNGPLIVLTGLALWAALRWSGPQRTAALRAVTWGAVLILATKAADTWLRITAVSRPKVLDEYAMLADHALAQPSWLVGRVLDAAGPIPSGLLHLIYIELPVAVMVVAVYQLRSATVGDWPGHHVLRTFVALGVIGPVCYVLFPVVGPIYAFGAEGHTFAVADYWPHLMPPVDLSPHAVVFDAVTPRNCMPSMHTAWALMVFIHSRGGPRWLRWGGTVWLVGTLLATLGAGYHYGVDLAAGAVLCLAVEMAFCQTPRGGTRARIWFVGAGATLFAALLLCYRYLAVPMAHFPLVFGPLIIGSVASYVVAFVVQTRRVPDPVTSRIPVAA